MSFSRSIRWGIPYDQNGVIGRRPAGAIEHAAMVTLETAAGIHQHGNRLQHDRRRQGLFVAFGNRDHSGNRGENCTGVFARPITSGVGV